MGTNVSYSSAGFSENGEWNFTIKLKGKKNDLKKIDNVEYVIPEHFQNDVVRVYGYNNGFELNTTVPEQHFNATVTAYSKSGTKMLCENISVALS